ncbi:hypothetical protein J6590_013657 [Homalodisca vitripennis]|nr:hypothetical protein J6590_013657 [Homalodisca vitripennis]
MTSIKKLMCSAAILGICHEGGRFYRRHLHYSERPKNGETNGDISPSNVRSLARRQQQRSLSSLIQIMRTGLVDVNPIREIKLHDK